MSNSNRNRSRRSTPATPFYGFREAPPGCALVPVTYGGEHVGNFLVDQADYERVNAWPWTLKIARQRNTYPQAHPSAGLIIVAARYVLDAGPGRVVDPINGNAFDCRRANLLLLTPEQWRQRSNRVVGASGFIGVHKCGGRWETRCAGRYVGARASAEAAARAYDTAALHHYGPHARVNFPEGES